MKQHQKQLKKKTVFFYRSMQRIGLENTDPTTSSITIISNGTRLHVAQ
ncbi:hypothetical protein GJU39_01275 [Pedobacter petrophilus]|uniref:Uncharacterized protein n=1 Tax=Pedobacter petrophilus TaxID=1908241 RepID=A0A7K0FSX1_9SPHI|nr:hypothetical protein [Pedobacter petrophilus]MRX74705.1 hypothetical protein [Pedobacter petrophilus]